MVGTSDAGTVDVDDAGADEELRWQPHVPPGREICSTALPDSDRRSQPPTRRHDMGKTFQK